MSRYGISTPLAAAIILVLVFIKIMFVVAVLWLAAIIFTVSTLIVTGTAEEFCAKSGFYAIRPAACLLFPEGKGKGNGR